MKTRTYSTLLLTILLLVVGFIASCKESTTPSGTTPNAKPEPAKPLIQKAEIADWCPEHGVPESICTRCNSSLIAQYQAKNDWCKEHTLPESQCFKCHPELEAKFKAMAPKDKR